MLIKPAELRRKCRTGCHNRTAENKFSLKGLIHCLEKLVPLLFFLFLFSFLVSPFVLFQYLDKIVPPHQFKVGTIRADGLKIRDRKRVFFVAFFISNNNAVYKLIFLFLLSLSLLQRATAGESQTVLLVVRCLTYQPLSVCLGLTITSQKTGP